MTRIVLNDEQAAAVSLVLEPVHVFDSKGNVLGVFTPIWTAQEIAEAKRRLASDQPRLTTAEVLEHLRQLENQ